MVGHRGSSDCCGFSLYYCGVIRDKSVVNWWYRKKHLKQPKIWFHKSHFHLLCNPRAALHKQAYLLPKASLTHKTGETQWTLGNRQTALCQILLQITQNYVKGQKHETDVIFWPPHSPSLLKPDELVIRLLSGPPEIIEVYWFISLLYSSACVYECAVLNCSSMLAA